MEEENFFLSYCFENSELDVNFLIFITNFYENIDKEYIDFNQFYLEVLNFSIKDKYLGLLFILNNSLIYQDYKLYHDKCLLSVSKVLEFCKTLDTEQSKKFLYNWTIMVELYKKYLSLDKN